MTITSRKNTLSIVQDLKDAGQDFEFYPTTKDQIDIIARDIRNIRKAYDFSRQYSEPLKVVDIGAGDGRVLKAIETSFSQDDDIKISSFAVEKAQIHTSTYREKNITLLGTEFEQVNFISKTCDIAFVNPPYSDFSYWLQNLLMHLNFGLLYAVIPERWKAEHAIKEAMTLRGVECAKVLAESDFINAERSARARVHLVRFSFEDLDSKAEKFKYSGRNYKPTIGISSTDPFQLFIENELGLKKTYSQTTNKFSEAVEKERIKEALTTEGTACFELVETKGVLWALLDNYERDLNSALEQYKLIAQIDSNLLKELGVDYSALCEGLREKSLGFRNVYWALLFEKLEAISGRLTRKHKQHLLNQLSSNSLDFTHTNAIYIIQYAVEVGNELIEQSLIDVYTDLTSTESISRYYKSNEHVFKDNWRYNQELKQKAKYLLDYRFIHSSWGNFSDRSWEKGLSAGARGFASDLMVAFKLLGYSNVYTDSSYDHVSFGDKLSIWGAKPSGEDVELLQIKFYKNGNRHLRFNQDAMLRFNVTASRLLGWVRCKSEFSTESDIAAPLSDSVWEISDEMKVTSRNILTLASKATC